MDTLEVQPCQAAVFEEESAVYIHYCEVFYEISITVTSLRQNAVFGAEFAFREENVCYTKE